LGPFYLVNKYLQQIYNKLYITFSITNAVSLIESLFLKYVLHFNLSDEKAAYSIRTKFLKFSMGVK